MGFDYAPPKYAQVVAEIKRRIERGEYPPGSLLPSEHQLVTDFGVSRPTIVKSLSALRQDGWIDTQQGKGSFVRGRPALAGAERTRPAENVLELPEAELVRRAGAGGRQARARLRDQRCSAWSREPRRSCGNGCSARMASRSSWPPCGCRWSWPPAPAWPPRNCWTRASGTISRPARRSASITPWNGSRPASRPARKPRCCRSRPDSPVLNVIVTAYDATARPLQVVDIVLPGDRHEIHDAYPFT